MWKRLIERLRQRIGGTVPPQPHDSEASTQYVPVRQPLGAPGGFWTDCSICLQCGAMEQEAPDLIGFDDETSTCFVRRQPGTDDEMRRMLRAMYVNEVEGLYYDGSDPDVVRQIRDAGLGHCIERSCETGGTRADEGP